MVIPNLRTCTQGSCNKCNICDRCYSYSLLSLKFSTTPSYWGCTKAAFKFCSLNIWRQHPEKLFWTETIGFLKLGLKTQLLTVTFFLFLQRSEITIYNLFTVLTNLYLCNVFIIFHAIFFSIVPFVLLKLLCTNGAK